MTNSLIILIIIHHILFHFSSSVNRFEHAVILFSLHVLFTDPTDPSKCTAAPDVEIPFIGSEEDRQGPPEQSTPQTKGAISLHGEL